MRYFVFAAAAAAMFAQEQRINTHVFAGEAQPMMVEFMRTEGPGGPTVKGKPYSAEGVNETVQVLQDGNRISRKSTSAVYRDTEGRTRTEQSFDAVGPWAGKARKITNINDPVAGTMVTLEPNMVARKRPAGRVM